MTGLFLGILALVMMCFFWIALGLIMVMAFFVFYGLPFLIFELIGYFTIYNIINGAARIPYIGRLLAFLLTIPYSILTLTCYCYNGFINIEGPAFWCFTGIPGGKAELIASCGETTLEPFHLLGWMGCNWNFNPACIFMNCFEWIYKYSGITHSVMPWFDTKHVFEEAGLIVFILKMTFMAIPYLAIFVIPLMFILWGFMRPIVGAMGRLPACMVKD